MIAITGASGFIGSYLSEHLPFPVKKLSRKKVDGAGWMTGDLTNPLDVALFVKDSPVLVHLACTTHPRSSNQNIQYDLVSNLLTTVSLFESYAKQNPGGHIVFSSTGGNIYLPSSNNRIHQEDELPSPQSSYGIHKLAIENYLKLICSLYRIRGTVLRISNPYGILLPKERAQGLIGVTFSKFLANEELNIFDTMDSVRDYIHLSDVTNAFKLVIEKPPQENEFRLYNVGSGQGHTLGSVVSSIESIVGVPLTKKFSAHPLQATYNVLSYEKIKKELAWQPSLTLSRGLEKMWHSIQQSQLVQQL